MLRSIEVPLQFIRFDDHKLGIFCNTCILVTSYFLLLNIVLMSTFKNENRLTLERPRGGWGVKLPPYRFFGPKI